MSKFEQRYCAFIDILGFANKIRELELSWNEQAYDRLRSCLNFMHEEQFDSAYSVDMPIYVVEDGRSVVKELGDIRLTYISDCIIISAARTPDGFTAICRKATKIWVDLLWDGYICRGAISGGPLLHEPTCIMGSAYMNAFELEKSARTPRVVIDKDLSEIYDNYPGVFPARPPTIERASDGFLYLRYFPYHFCPPYVPSWNDYLLFAKSHIQSGLRHQSNSIREKYTFLMDEYNFTIETYRKLISSEVTLIGDDDL